MHCFCIEGSIDMTRRVNNCNKLQQLKPTKANVLLVRLVGGDFMRIKVYGFTPLNGKYCFKKNCNGNSTSDTECAFLSAEAIIIVVYSFIYNIGLLLH